jgi:hypothetical protein
MTARTWQRIRGFTDGFTYFKCPEEPGRIYVADRSGNTPDSTDVGPMRLSGPLSADRYGVNVEVIDDHGSASPRRLGFDEALWVSQFFGFRINTKYGVFVVLTAEQHEELNQG